MLQIRLFEDLAQRLFLANEIEGSIHLYQGEEAVAVGVCDALEPEDAVAATYRGHGVLLARGSDPARAVRGAARPRDRPLRWPRRLDERRRSRARRDRLLRDRRRLDRRRDRRRARIQLREDDTVAVAFFGDGAVNQAYFHECLNFAGVRQLPVVYVCENNQYGEFTPVRRGDGRRADRAAGGAYGLPGSRSTATMSRRSAQPRATPSNAHGRATDRRCSSATPTGTRDTHAMTIRAGTDPTRSSRPGSPRPAVARRSAARPGLGRREARARIEERSTQRSNGARTAPQPDPGRACVGDEGERMTELSFRLAVRDALAEEMEPRRAVVLLGEDVRIGGVFNATPELFGRFGPTRVLDTPISELGFTARHSAPPFAACGPWSRSCSPTSSGWSSTRSRTRRRSTGTSRTSRRASRSSSARRSVPAVASGRSTPRRRPGGCWASPG